MNFYRIHCPDKPDPSADGRTPVLVAVTLVPAELSRQLGVVESWGGMAFAGPSGERYYLLDRKASALLDADGQSERSFWQSVSAADFTLLMYNSSLEARAFCDWLLARSAGRRTKSGAGPQLSLGL